MSTRRCLDCDEPISARRRRCPECKRKDHARAQRERRAAESGQGTAAYDTLLGQRVIDYTQAASRPPQYSGIATQPEAPRVEPELTDGRVPSPAERWAATTSRDLTGVPASIRKDRARLDSVLAHQNLGLDDELPELTSWENLTAAAERHDGKVTFPAPNLDPPSRYDSLGRPTRRQRNGLR